MIDRRGVLTAIGVAAVARSAAAAPARPNLEGVWTSASYTDLQRPNGIKNLVLTPAEAEAYEAPRRALHGLLPSTDNVGQGENEFIDRGEGLARVKGQIRSSWIVDPPDGRIPFTAWALERGYDRFPARQGLDGPEDRIATERCVGSATAGAPMAPTPDTNLFQIVQTRDAVVIVSEKYHDARVIRLWEITPPAPLPPSWLGDSTGRWEGATLVVETCGLRPGVVNRNFGVCVSGDTRVTERFTRLGSSVLFYRFTVTDPLLYVRPWRAEMSLSAAGKRMFEYACHEGNYSLPGILAGARREERLAKAGGE